MSISRLSGLLAAICLLLPLQRVHARQGGDEYPVPVRRSGDEFASIAIGLGPLVQANTTDIDTAWEPGTGFGLILSTPFYFGEVALGYRFTPHGAITSGVPSTSWRPAAATGSRPRPSAQ